MPAAAISAAALAAAAFLAAGATQPGDLGGTFEVDAVYDAGSQSVTVSFEDAGGGSTLVTMEVLGMGESFQRRYAEARFVEVVPFGPPPQLGWKVHPVTFAVEHRDLGEIGIKTEIREPGGPRPAVIYSRP